MALMKRFPVLMILVLLAFEPVVAEQFTIKVGVNLVNLLFSVTDDKGRFVAGLGPGDAAFFEPELWLWPQHMRTI